MPDSPPASWRPPRLACFIAGTTRSGSTYLSALMENTEVLGRPREFFNHTVELFGAKGVETPAVTPELSAPLARRAQLFTSVGMTPNGVAATKMFRPHLVWMSKHLRIAEWFPNLKWLMLTREDKLGQAISSAIVSQTKRFNGAALPDDPQPEYRGDRIYWVMRYNLSCEAFFQAYFIVNQITPLRVTYEDLDRDPAPQIRRIADYLGEPLHHPVDTKTRLVTQRTGLNEEWRERFLKEYGGLERVEYTPHAIKVPRTFASFARLLKGDLRVGPVPDPID